jgi:DNA-binding transcriptional LysR family regulator
MRFEQLEYIAAVTRFGSLRRAGEELHISQPALSATVRNLERELGVTLLDRQRSGSRISADGRELLPHFVDILEAVDRLRAAADQQHRSRRMIRIGTVNAATAPLLTPAIREFTAAVPGTQVEVLNVQQADIHRGLLEGGIDLGLVNLLDGDDAPADVATVELLSGRPVVCCHPDSELTRLPAVTLDRLRREPIIAMRSGYLMHRYLHRAYAGEPPAFAYSTDGAEMGKLMVAQGLGVTVLPDYSVVGDPLEIGGCITHRPLDTGAADVAGVRLVLQHRRVRHLPQSLRIMQGILRAQARAVPDAAERASLPAPREPR